MTLFKKVLKVVLYFHAVLLAGAVAVQCTVQHYADASYLEAAKEIPFDVIIVPGMPYQAAGINPIYKARILWAKHLLDSGYTKNIIFSGSAVYTPYIESRTMKLFAEAAGLNSDNIFTEEKAEHSSENVYYSWKLARKLGFKKIALATDPYQSGLLQGLIRKYTPGVMSLPIQFEKIDGQSKVLPAINPATAHVHPFIALPDREGIWERFMGTLGKRVQAEAQVIQP